MEALQHKINYASDGEIIRKILDGETMLFEILIRRYNPLLYKIARSCGFTHHDAEDLMQESYCAVFLNLKTFRGDASFKTWLTKIHLNRCYQKMNHGHQRYEEIDDSPGAGQTYVMELSSGNEDTEKRILSKELGQILEANIQQIPLLYRTVFVLREIEGFTVAETAELLGITAMNVKVRLNRAKAMLQKQLEKVYSVADLYEFHFKYCDKIVKNVFERIAAANLK